MEFKERLPILLKKIDFALEQIQFEANLLNEYVVSKSNSRSMLAYMNGMVYQLEHMCTRFDRYEDIALNLLEEKMMRWPYQDPNKKSSFTTSSEYWKQRTTKQ